LTPHDPTYRSMPADGSDLPDAGAPDEMRWLSDIPDSDPIFIGIIGLPDTISVTVGSRDYMPLGSGETFSQPNDKS
jgi:hypothetical protein